ncbi:MAG: ECF transporter S component [Oscillospiraceae bacterium]|nr:ECF transporter S component [Oscillospiraceae bacterium]
MKKEISNVRWMTVTALMGALAAVLEMLNFPIPALIPGFIKFDVSEMPALISSFALGPVSGMCVCLIKNLVKLVLGSSTAGVGELSNFILGCAFVVPAGLIYKSRKTKTTAMIGSVVGAVTMALLSVVSNYFVIYPIYAKAFGGMEAIIGAYKAIDPKADTLMYCLLRFNMPFTLIKGLASAGITAVVYKHISPIIKKADPRATHTASE